MEVYRIAYLINAPHHTTRLYLIHLGTHSEIRREIKAEKSTLMEEICRKAADILGRVLSALVAKENIWNRHTSKTNHLQNPCLTSQYNDGDVCISFKE